MSLKNVKLGNNVVIPHLELVNLYGCEIGDNCSIGPFCEIQADVIIGEGTRVQSHTFICSKVRVGRNCFIGHSVVFINDRHPVHRDPKDWEEVIIEDSVVIGSNATIFPCRIGKGAVIGAGSVVLKDVEAGKTVAGNPARYV
ncbi:N-acetyltransferase [Patescibacteria group bacterium]|nr:N-acetyltransferase [Patescibacteria group bacterium]